MSISFINKPKGSIVGSGDYVFRHYGSEIQPSTGLDASGTWEVSAGRAPLTLTPFEYNFVNGVARNDNWTITINNVPDGTYNIGGQLLLNGFVVDGSRAFTLRLGPTGTMTVSNGVIVALSLSVTFAIMGWAFTLSFSVSNGESSCTFQLNSGSVDASKISSALSSEMLLVELP